MHAAATAPSPPIAASRGVATASRRAPRSRPSAALRRSGRRGNTTVVTQAGVIDADANADADATSSTGALPGPPPGPDGACSLFVFGLGYTSLGLVSTLKRAGWRVAGTCRSVERIESFASAGRATWQILLLVPLATHTMRFNSRNEGLKIFE